MYVRGVGRLARVVALSLPCALAACLGGARVEPPVPLRMDAEEACPIVPVPRTCEAYAGTVRATGEPTIEIFRGWEKERYEVDTRTDDIRIRAGSDEGVLRARTTLALLRRGDRVPRRLVVDSPKLAWRGLLVDVARHPLSVEELEHLVDRMALLKLRVLHLHLSDDQGFRLALASHPELAAKGGTRVEKGKSVSLVYSKADVARLLAYAARRFVEVVPEIDLPGHTRAILASHPELSCRGAALEVPSEGGVYDDVLCLGNPATLPLVLDVLTEVASMFPSRYVHVGGDEVGPARWSECEKCRAAARSAGHASVRALQGDFVRRVSAHLARLGKVAIGWDEVLDVGAPARMPVMVWQNRDAVQKALHEGHDVILVPNDRTYLDARPTDRDEDLPASSSGGRLGADRALPWEDVVRFDPSEGDVPGAKGLLLGGEAALWTEHVHSLADADRLLFPRLLPVAEALWSGARARPAIATRSRAMGPTLDLLGARGFVEPPSLPRKKLFIDAADLAISPSPLYGDDVEVAYDDGPFEKYSGPRSLVQSTRVRAFRIAANGDRSVLRESLFSKTVPLPPRGAAPSRHGVTYRVCPAAVTSAKSQIACATPREGTLPRFELPKEAPQEAFVVGYASVLVAPASGVYTFVVTSDDGAVLEVDGTLVVDNDGVHPPRARRGEIALAEGPHTVSLAYFQGKGGAQLDVRVAGPTVPEGDGEKLWYAPERP